MKNSTIPKVFEDNFSSVDHSYQTRFAVNSFQLPRSSKTSKFSIILRGPKIWNHFLNDEDKSSPTLSSFKHKMKTKILDSNNEIFFF